MMSSRIRLLEAAVCAVLALGCARAQDPCCEVTVELLQSAGFHLPSYMPTMLALRQYTSVLTTHQELTIDWDSLPGQPPYVSYENVKWLPLSGNFVITERKRKIKGPTGIGSLALNEHGLVVVGITSASQVRSLWVRYDPRVTQGEDLTPGRQYSEFVVKPHVTFRLYLPDDPQIQTLAFLRPVYNGQKWTLQPIGTLPLPRN
jgi:hypothetical protein